MSSAKGGWLNARKSSPFSQFSGFPVVLNDSCLSVKGRQHSFNSPTFCESVTEYHSIDADNSAPFGQRVRLSLKSQDSIVTSIVGLCENIIPPRIHRPATFYALRAFATRIIAIIINAIDRQAAVGTFSYVCQEIKELSPALADCNSTFAISMSGLAVRVKAAPHHVRPRAVCESMRLAVRDSSAAAPDCMRVWAHPNGEFFTVTAAKPIASPVPAFKARAKVGIYRQSVEGLADKIFNAVKISFRESRKNAIVKFGHLVLRSESMSRGFRVFPHPVASIC